MVLVDKDIKARANEIFIKNYKEENVKSMSYDLRVKEVVDKTYDGKFFELKPKQMCFVRMMEEIDIPLDLTARISTKYGRLLEQCMVIGPDYQPGHKTAIVVAVYNLSSEYSFIIKEGSSLCQLIFSQLSGIPDVPYNKQANAKFNLID